MFLILVTVFAGLSGSALAQLTDAEIQQILDQHNACRNGTGANLTPMTWDTNLASFAAGNAVGQNCKEKHTSKDLRHNVPGFVGQDVGENIAGGMKSSWTSADTLTMIAEGVSGWCAEQQGYDYASNTCAGSYTQVVWDTSVQVGCTLTLCTSDTSYQMVCNYFTAGNMNGERRGHTGAATEAPSGTAAPVPPGEASPGAVTEEPQTPPPNCTPSTNTETVGTDTVTTTVTCENNSQKTTVTTLTASGHKSTSSSTKHFS